MNRRTIDRGTLLGVIVALSGVISGLLLDGGTLRQILQPTAALIVLGGTLGAVMMQFPSRILLQTAYHLRYTLLEPGIGVAEVVEELVGYCSHVRRHGMLTLDAKLERIEDDFLRRALTLAVDGSLVREVRETLEVELLLNQEREEQMPRVLEAAGGFAPTLGIIGAVLGLIQVMQHMDHVSEIGKGIAVAFVSTLYGIGLANLLLLPLAGRLRIRIREQQVIREMMLEAVIAIMEGSGARALRRRLECFVTRPSVKPQELLEPEMATR